MSNTGTVMLAIWTVILASAGITRADEKAAESNPQQQSLEIRRRFAELSRKVNELPELKGLKADAEKAQVAYSAAFEAAMAKEDPQILAQYRSLFESRIQRLQGARQIVPPVLPTKTELPVSEGDLKRLAEAQRKAMGAVGVQETLKNWNAAGTEEQREVAKAQYLSALRSAMIEADPSLKPLLVEAGAEASPVSADGGTK